MSNDCGVVMKRFSIVLLVFAVVLTGCTGSPNDQNAQNSDKPSTSVSKTEPTICAEHDFQAATLLDPRICSVCTATDGEPLYKQCETWEDVVGCSQISKYSYELSVIDSGNNVVLSLDFTDDSQFATEDSVKEFMVVDIYGLTEIFGFAGGECMGIKIDTPAAFNVKCGVQLKIPGGTIYCFQSAARQFGIMTTLSCNEESPNASIIQSAYDFSFGSLGIDI